jgi:hypothetical protein
MKRVYPRPASQKVFIIMAIGLVGATVAGCSRPAQTVTTPSAPGQTPLQSEGRGADLLPRPAGESGQVDGPNKDAAGDAPSVSETQPAPKSEAAEWTSLFDGKSLGNWEPTRFGGEGDVTIDKAAIVLQRGNDMTGITWKGDPPARLNYELEIEAQRVDGGDFFCGLTFPVGEEFCSLICGGWGGGLTGLSSLDGHDASENETSKWLDYDKGRWYRIRLRVTDQKIEAWLDDKPVVGVETAGRKIGIRPEVELSKPLGISTWNTTGAIRSIRLRRLTTAAAANEATKEPAR